MTMPAEEPRAEDGVFVRVERDDNPPTSERVPDPQPLEEPGQ